MKEEKYIHTSGNFLICDVQEEYAEYLLSVLAKYFGMQFQFHFFSDPEKVTAFEENAEIEVILIAEECYQKVKGSIKAKKTFILTENMKRCSEEGEIVVFRYQSAEEILNVIKAGVGENENCLKATEKKDPEFVKEKNVIKQNAFLHLKRERCGYETNLMKGE